MDGEKNHNINQLNLTIFDEKIYPRQINKDNEQKVDYSNENCSVTDRYTPPKGGDSSYADRKSLPSDGMFHYYTSVLESYN